MESIKTFLKTSDLDALWEDGAVVWIDHREYDEDIVRYSEKLLNTGKLSAKCIDADNELGYDLIICYDGKEMTVPFDISDVSRDTTLCTLNALIRPDYEVRLWMDSIGGDTLAFIPLSADNWKKLESEFGKEKVLYHFPVMNENERMFRLSFDEVAKIVKERGL